jgi:hypothetical protein
MYYEKVVWLYLSSKLFQVYKNILTLLAKCLRVAADSCLFFVLSSIFYFRIDSRLFLQLTLESVQIK